MKLKSLANSVTSKVGKQLLTAKQHSPSIMFAAGVVGIGATVVLACRSTLKVEEVLNEVDANMEKIEQASALGLDNYGPKAQQRDKVVVYTKAAYSLAKLYGPALIVGGVSIALLTGSHIALKNRVAGLSAAYALLDKGFKEYRKRVIDELGEDKDREFRYGYEDKEYLVEGENGPEVVHERVAKNGESIYARWFDPETTKEWSPSIDNNILKLRATQDYANHRLNARGYVLLNEIYIALGMKPTTAGAVVGWVRDQGDGFIDLGCWGDTDMDSFKNFMHRGHASAVLIDPNVDGEVFRLIDKLESEN